MQLPPTVVSDEAARKGLGNTLFERLQVIILGALLLILAWLFCSPMQSLLALPATCVITVMYHHDHHVLLLFIIIPGV